MIFLLNKIYLRSYNASFIPILIRVLIEFIKLELFNNIYLIIEFDFSQGYKEIPRIQRYSKKSWPRIIRGKNFRFSLQ